VLPIAEYERLLEDLNDLAVVAERRNEPTVAHEEFIVGNRDKGEARGALWHSETTNPRF
jgi:hypothetical protein